MQTSLTIVRYKYWAIPFAFFSMFLFRIPLFFNRKITFYKLMGSGKNGTFDKSPDLKQWAILCVHTNNILEQNTEELLGGFISNWFSFFSTDVFTIILEPIMGHGLWDKKEVFGKLSSKSEIVGPVATLTRATIRLNKMKYFWENVAPVAKNMNIAKGFVFSVGIGEVPWIKQATFSIWETADDMKSFAYKMKAHSEVVKKTREENWYSEELFVRFKVLKTNGTLHGINPLKRIL